MSLHTDYILLIICLLSNLYSYLCVKYADTFLCLDGFDIVSYHNQHHRQNTKPSSFTWCDQMHGPKSLNYN